MAEEVGKLVHKSEVVGGVSKAGKQWQKIQFVIQVKGAKFPRQVAFDTLSPELIQFVQDTSMDTDLRVSYEVESREYKGKYYTNCKAFRAEIYRDEQQTPPPMPPDDDDLLPF